MMFANFSHVAVTTIPAVYKSVRATASKVERITSSTNHYFSVASDPCILEKKFDIEDETLVDREPAPPSSSPPPPAAPVECILVSWRDFRNSAAYSLFLPSSISTKSALILLSLSMIWKQSSSFTREWRCWRMRRAAAEAPVVAPSSSHMLDRGVIESMLAGLR
jgi:hypothetical protein